MEKLKNIALNILGGLSNLLVKEDTRLERLLRIEPEKMYLLLPKSRRYIEKDCFAMFDYTNGVIKTIIKSIKFKNNLAMKERFALYLYDEILSLVSDVELFSGSKPLITAVPMSKDEKKERGFNQCEEILSVVKRLSSDNLDIRFDILEKTRDTARQVKLSREERLKNIRNSIQVKKEKVENIKDRVVVVFDDVYTTGATFGEARRALGAAGARQVYGLFLAH